jgi:hypothetical protein
MIAYLFDKPLVEDDISVGTVECLFQEGKKNRNDDNSLQSLSKDDKEDWHGKEVDSHG